MDGRSRDSARSRLDGQNGPVLFSWHDHPHAIFRRGTVALLLDRALSLPNPGVGPPLDASGQRKSHAHAARSPCAGCPPPIKLRGGSSSPPPPPRCRKPCCAVHSKFITTLNRRLYNLAGACRFPARRPTSLLRSLALQTFRSACFFRITALFDHRRQGTAATYCFTASSYTSLHAFADTPAMERTLSTPELEKNDLNYGESRSRLVRFGRPPFLCSPFVGNRALTAAVAFPGCSRECRRDSGTATGPDSADTCRH